LTEGGKKNGEGGRKKTETSLSGRGEKESKRGGEIWVRRKNSEFHQGGGDSRGKWRLLVGPMGLSAEVNNLRSYLGGEGGEKGVQRK